VPRAGLTARAVVDIAMEIIDSQGRDALALSLVAARAGVAPPSLYKHVGSLAELRALVAARVLDDMTEAATAAVMGLGGDAAVTALMRRIRDYAVAYPERYLAVPPDPVHDPALAGAANRLLAIFLAVLRFYHLRGSAAVHAVRSLRVIVHGFAVTEASGGFGLSEDTAETFDHLIRMYLASLPRR
jgi:AcrR family transcriptional regulator